MHSNKPWEGKASATVFLEGRVSNTLLLAGCSQYTGERRLGKEPGADCPAQTTVTAPLLDVVLAHRTQRHFLFLVSVVHGQQTL